MTRRLALMGSAVAAAVAITTAVGYAAIPDSSGLFKQTGDQRSRGFELDASAEPVPVVY